MDENRVRKAIEALKEYRKLAKCMNDMERLPYYDLAIEALEKQLTKNPTYDGDGYAPDGTFIFDEWLCPNCGSRYEVDYDDYSYCPNCGQRIDREEEEEL